jgi:glycerophosphoryl diester phosphodiesterase
VLDASARIVLLIEPGDAGPWLSEAALARAAAFATGIGPGKPILEAHPELVGMAHQAGLTVTPWTFRSRTCGAPFADVRAEMAYYLDVLGVDGVVTDHPDQFPT